MHWPPYDPYERERETLRDRHRQQASAHLLARARRLGTPPAAEGRLMRLAQMIRAAVPHA